MGEQPIVDLNAWGDLRELIVNQVGGD